MFVVCLQYVIYEIVITFAILGFCMIITLFILEVFS